jgi:23S rRNA (cytidine1920-2'-O)/16S rRNA (cytidine1409-2'-O)-methyltransferase
MSKTPKMRVDQLLVDQGFFDSRTRAQAALMAGVVYLDNQRIDKAGTSIPVDSPLEVRGKDCPYVSRGGLKLAKALEVFHLEVQGLRILDLGSSTGGFCDCLLQNGAANVIAVDVGKGQLHLKLREDARISVHEQTNARYLEPEQFEPVDAVTGDLSFISLSLLFPVVQRFLPADPLKGWSVMLIKPQFECGPKHLRKGVVRDAAIHLQVLKDIAESASNHGLSLTRLDFSPVKGPAGNIEYLGFFQKKLEGRYALGHTQLQEIVDNSHTQLSPIAAS